MTISPSTVVTLPVRPWVAPALRVRQASDRVVVAQRVVAEAAHPARIAHVPLETRQAVARHYAAAQRHLAAAEILLNGGQRA